MKKAIYDLKEGPHVWNKKLVEVLSDAGLIQSKNDYCLFILEDNEENCYVLVYVDNILVVTSNTTLLKRVTSKLESSFKIKSLEEVRQFFGMSVKF